MTEQGNYSGTERRAVDGRSKVDRRRGLDRRRGPGRRRSDVRRPPEEGELNHELLQFVLALWQRGRNQPLAAAISASMSPAAAAILTGNPGAVVALTPAAAMAHVPPTVAPG